VSAPSATEVHDSTDATLSLLRELRRSHVRKRAANMAYWLYLGGLAVFIYGGWLVAAVAKALRHPPPMLADTAAVARAAPAGLCALSLAALAVVLWEARWRGPVVISQPSADWLLDTPVRRARLLRPRYRASTLIRFLTAAVAGMLPAAFLLAAGLGGVASRTLQLAGVAMLSAALFVGLGTGVAAVAEAHPASQAVRLVIPAFGLAAAGAAGLAAVAAAGSLPTAVSTALLWSGPWGWAAHGVVAFAGGAAPFWPAAVVLLAAAWLTALIAGDRAAGRVPAAALRARARTIGHMTAAVANLDARRIGAAYHTAAGGYGRVMLVVPPPRWVGLILPWRDLTALLRAPVRLASTVLMALAAAGLGALAVHSPHSALLPLAGALALGYPAASGLCEGARLDADDPQRSAHLPFRYDSLARRHAIVPCLALTLFGGVPAAVLAIAAGRSWLLPLIGGAILALVAGAVVNAYRGPLEAETLASGFETPVGNSGAIVIVLWYVTGPLLAIGPLIFLSYRAISAARLEATATSFIFSIALAVWLGSIAARRAGRLPKS
jgi:Family of unknown function (DUF6297)